MFFSFDSVGQTVCHRLNKGEPVITVEVIDRSSVDKTCMTLIRRAVVVCLGWGVRR